jgi:hypothetical protein
MNRHMVWVGLKCKSMMIAFGLGWVCGGFETISRSNCLHRISIGNWKESFLDCKLMTTSIFRIRTMAPSCKNFC